MLTDLFVYDWWALILGWARNDESEGAKMSDLRPQAEWVQELMAEQDVKALPRSMEQLGRCYDSREFWAKFKLTPVRARLL